jgi:hypothetical protein
MILLRPLIILTCLTAILTITTSCGKKDESSDSTIYGSIGE